MSVVRYAGVLTMSILAPGEMVAQVSKADSIAIVTALAPELRKRIGNTQAIKREIEMTPRPSAVWNPLFEQALIALDSAVITRKPTGLTTRFYVLTAIAAGDSAVINLGTTHCDGERFAGGSMIYTLKRAPDGWRLIGSRFGGSGHGRCTA